MVYIGQYVLSWVYTFNAGFQFSTCPLVLTSEKCFKLSLGQATVFLNLIIFIAMIVGVATPLFTYTWLLYQLLL